MDALQALQQMRLNAAHRRALHIAGQLKRKTQERHATPEGIAMTDRLHDQLMDAADAIVWLELAKVGRSFPALRRGFRHRHDMC
jgi:hypothetical protein